VACGTPAVDVKEMDDNGVVDGTVESLWIVSFANVIHGCWRAFLSSSCLRSLYRFSPPSGSASFPMTSRRRGGVRTVSSGQVLVGRLNMFVLVFYYFFEDFKNRMVSELLSFLLLGSFSF
jgi:hypothetical protein